MPTAIRVENLSKLYRLGEIGTGSLAHDVNRWWHRIRGKEDPYARIGESNDRATKGESQYVWALKDIDFEIEQGEVVGIIGRNGAGKSTLLKILSRVTSPTRGVVRARGRIASLLEVGTGFHPELTGRENIYLNGAILGMRKHGITRKLDEIVEFSGCERYINTPVKRYSSGMYVRLAFAVAAHLDTDILIVDEVLAVGDGEFQKKCLGKMSDVASDGKTVIFVSHNLAAVRNLCTHAMVYERGALTFEGRMAEGLSYYENSFSSPVGLIAETHFHGSLSTHLRFDALVCKQGDVQVAIIDPMCPVRIELHGVSHRSFPRLELKLSVFRDGFLLASCHDTQSGSQMGEGPFTSRFDVPGDVFRPGRYTVGIGASALTGTWTWGSDVATLEFSENFGGRPADRTEGVLAIPYVGRRIQ